MPLYDFVVVKGDNYQYHSFWKLDSGSYVYPTDYDSTVNTLKLYPWEKQAKFQMSFSEYESEFTKLRKTIQSLSTILILMLRSLTRKNQKRQCYMRKMVICLQRRIMMRTGNYF